MRYAIVCMSFGVLALLGATGCQRAETPTAGETPPAQDSEPQDTQPQDSTSAAGAATSLNASLSGAEEVPGPGDPDGTGTAQVTVDPAKNEICYELSVQNIQAANASHIHTGAAGVAGPVAVPLDAPAEGTSKNCTNVDATVAQDIAQNPANYYVNVHNPEFPPGAVRGQLKP